MRPFDALARFLDSRRAGRAACGVIVAASVLLAAAFAAAGQYGSAAGYGFSAVIGAFAFGLNCFPE